LENFIKKNEGTLERFTPLSWYGGVYRYLLDTKSIDDESIQKMMKKIESCQRNDGGFQLETKGTSSSVIETAIAVDFLLDIGKPRDSKVIAKAVDFLLSWQREDGGFAESPNVKHPVDWDDRYIYEKRISTPHVTAWVLRALFKARFPKESSAVDKALQYLAMHQKEDGGWSHFKSEKKSCPYLTGLILITLGGFSEFKDAIDISSLRKYYINRQKNNGSIGDCLDASLLVAEAWANMEINVNEPNMQRLLEWIKQQQNPDGSFIDKDCGWPDTLENRIKCSMNVLRIMHKTVWEGEEKWS
jgi:prenyltransferase beta subunit